MNKLPNARVPLYTLVAVALIGVLGFLVAQARSVNFEAYNDIINTLRDLKQVDAEWNVDVLRSKTGLANDYDPVASPLPLIASLQEKLDQGTKSYWGISTDSEQRLKPLLANFSSLMDQKINAIEHFKSQNAILRNSSRFLPVAAAEVASAVRDSSMPADSKVQIERQLNDLLADAMTYVQTPDAGVRDRITAGATQLHDLTAVQPEAVRETAATLIAHANTVLRQQDAGAELLATLTALPTAKAIDDLTDAQARENDRMLATMQRYPLITTVMLTRSADADLVIKLINRAQIYRFATKPLRRTVFQLAVSGAMKEHLRFKANPKLVARHRVEQSEGAEDTHLMAAVARSLGTWRLKFLRMTGLQR